MNTMNGACIIQDQLSRPSSLFKVVYFLKEVDLKFSTICAVELDAPQFNSIQFNPVPSA